ncbi:LysR family transcriptional regulator [Inquilinus sp. CAU 1745]|uniref:LysR family transcriptional regulator n=1 Tax=Inquilinus sp. CAU 1745 TaxID=3140369 RepID=UPI00325C1A77
MIAELKTLVAVARYGTFAAAGDRVGLTQAAVSGQMKRLEERLGRRLFDRTGRSARLNDTGRTVLARAGELLALADSLADPFDPSRQTGLLRIGAIASVQPTILRRAMPGFHGGLPGVQVRVVPGTSMELLDRLDSGDLDLAMIIRPAFETPQGLGWETLVREPFVLAAPRSWECGDWRTSLNDRPFLRYNRSSFGGRQVERFLDRRGILVRDWAELDDIPTILAMVSDGLGVALVPKARAYEEGFDQVSVVPLDDAAFVREVGIIHPSPGTDAAARFIAECRAAAG